MAHRLDAAHLCNTKTGPFRVARMGGSRTLCQRLLHHVLKDRKAKRGEGASHDKRALEDVCSTWAKETTAQSIDELVRWPPVCNNDLQACTGRPGLEHRPNQTVVVAVCIAPWMEPLAGYCWTLPDEHVA